MFGDFSKLLNIITILLIIFQIKLTFANDTVKIINYANDIDSLKLVINCSNYQDFNYKISLSLHNDDNNNQHTFNLDESNLANIDNNNIIESYIPVQSDIDQVICSIKIMLENDEKSLIFESQSFKLSKLNEEAQNDSIIYINLLNNESNKNEFLSIIRSSISSNTISSAEPSKTKYIAQPTTTFNNYERKPIHTMDLETFPSLSLHPESIESLLKLDSNYDSAARLPLTARKLNLR